MLECWTANFCIHASKSLVIIMYQLKSIYNSSFNYSHSQPIHTCFPIIASNDQDQTEQETDAETERDHKLKRFRSHLCVLCQCPIQQKFCGGWDFQLRIDLL